MFPADYMSRIQFQVIYNIVDYKQLSRTMLIESFRSTKTIRNNPEVCIVKQLIPKKWKAHMMDELDKMMNEKPNKNSLITDIKTIVLTIPQANFIQAALQVRPFKPEFVEETILKGEVTDSTTTSTIINAAKFKQNSLKKTQKVLLKQRITEKSLKHQFQKDYHPYKFVIKNFCRLLQLKYKHLMDNKNIKVCEVQSMLKEDLNIFNQFICRSSTPYKKLFKIDKGSDEELSYKKMLKFIQTFIFENQKISTTCHKILLYSSRKQYTQQICQKIPNFATPEQYEIPQDFQIDGCYIRSMNSLMQFSQNSNHQKSMQKLMEFRSNILKDIDQYYKNKNGSSKQLQLSAEAQIEIIRFIVAKLKGWACQIYSQIKFLELMYGDEQIAYKYEQISFMYTQLSLTFQIIQIQ